VKHLCRKCPPLRTNPVYSSYIQGRVHIGKELKQRKLSEQATKGKELIRDVHKVRLRLCCLADEIRTLFWPKFRNLQTLLRLYGQMYTPPRTLKPRQTNASKIRLLPLGSSTATGMHRMGLTSRITPLSHWNSLIGSPSRCGSVCIGTKPRLRFANRDLFSIPTIRTFFKQIERKLASASAQAQHTPQCEPLCPHPWSTTHDLYLFTAIASTLQAQHATFVALANKTAAIDAELQKIKTLYTQLWRARTGSMRDPFNELDRGTGKDFGLEGLSV